MKRPEMDEGAAIGCLIILFGGCAAIGGLVYFIKIVIALLTGAKL